MATPYATNGLAPAHAAPAAGHAAAPAAPILELSGVRASYGTIEALHGIDLSVPAGGIFAVLGPNGAGKSTMLRVIAGLHPATAGSIVVAGRSINRARPDELARRGLCLIPEGRGVFPNLTVAENLRVVTRVGVGLKEVESRTYEYFPRLAERRGQLAGTLSGGEQQMLALARAVATEPGLLLIDELSMGLAPRIVENLYELVTRIAAGGVTVVAVEQFARTVLGIASSAAVITTGRVVLSGRPQDVESALSDLYLGVGVDPALSSASPASSEPAPPHRNGSTPA
jgi:branched-chain amino acid transport system ATP-binding protein